MAMLGRRHPQRAGGDPPLQLLLAEDRRHRAEMGVAVEVAEAHLLAVGEEHERHVQRGGVGQGLRLGLPRLTARALGLHHRQRLPLPVAQHVVGPGAVRKRMLEPDAPAVRELPAGIPELLVDPDPRERFVPTHAGVVPASGTHGKSHPRPRHPPLSLPLGCQARRGTSSTIRPSTPRSLPPRQRHP